MKKLAIFRQHGFSLVELMVGMILGLFLVLGIGQVFVSNNNTFRTQEGMAKIQEGGRFAMQHISSAIRSAGFFGCAGLNSKIKYYVIADPAPDGLDAINLTTPVSGQNNVASGDIGGKTLVVNSDTITLRGSGGSGMDYTGIEVAPGEDVPIANGNVTFKEEDYVLVTDCSVADLFRATSASLTSIKHDTTCDTSGDTCNKRATLSKLYGADAIVVQPYSKTFFVADSGRTNAQGNAVMSLYLKGTSGTVAELVEGVSMMQVLYGVDTNNDHVAERYMDTPTSWQDVVSVRVSLLMDSVDDAANAPVDYTFLGASYSSPVTDRRMKKEFTGLFTLRNRVE